jgi:hypothetical protein
VSQLVDEHKAARRIGMSVAFLRADRYRGHAAPARTGMRSLEVVRYENTDTPSIRWVP